MDSIIRSDYEKYMTRCLHLATLGEGYVAPNPMVGALLVFNDTIVSEGYHKKYGQPHAEPNAINQIKDSEILKNSVLYVNLEPCSHYNANMAQDLHTTHYFLIFQNLLSD